MKKIYIISFLVIIFLLIINNAFATRLNQEEGIFPNHSAEYVRTLNRNASTSADAAFYNPAGLAFMKKTGLYIMLSNQTLIANREHSMNYKSINVNNAGYLPTTISLATFAGDLPDKYTSDITSPILPDLDIVYKGITKGHEWAVFFDLSVMQAAPDVTFSDGLAIMDWGQHAVLETALYGSGTNTTFYSRDANAVRTEYYISGTIGGSYKILNWLSASLGFRYIYIMGSQIIESKNNILNGDYLAGLENIDTNANSLAWAFKWDIDTEYQGHGFGLILGFHFQPIKKIDIGLRYEYYPPMNAKKKTNKFIAPEAIESSGQLDVFKDGNSNSDYDPNGDGAGYNNGSGDELLKVTYPQSLSLGVSYRIIKQLRLEVDGQITLPGSRDLDGAEKKFNEIGFRLGGCVEWTIRPWIILSVGYAYTDYGVKSEERNEIDPLLTNHTFGGGLGFVVNDMLTLNLGAFYVYYVPYSHEEIAYTNVSGPTNHKIDKEFKESRLSIAIGLTFRFFGDKSNNETGIENKI